MAGSLSRENRGSGGIELLTTGLTPEVASRRRGVNAFARRGDGC
jgi:hypothetical protein